MQIFFFIGISFICFVFMFFEQIDLKWVFNFNFFSFLVWIICYWQIFTCLLKFLLIFLLQTWHIFLLILNYYLIMQSFSWFFNSVLFLKPLKQILHSNHLRECVPIRNIFVLLFLIKDFKVSILGLYGYLIGLYLPIVKNLIGFRTC